MICPNCKSNIPDDSKFCPDCGTPVKNEEEIRKEASQIISSYKRGYNFFVNIDSLPHYSSRLTIASCEKIIEKKADIIRKHQEIESIERQKEEDAIRREASSITIRYAKGYNFYVSHGTLPRFVHNLNIEDCQKIISKKNDIIERQQEIDAKENRLAQEKRIEEEQKPTRTKSTDASHSCASSIAFSWGWFFISIVIGVVALFCGWLGENHTLGIIVMVVISIIVGFTAND